VQTNTNMWQLNALQCLECPEEVGVAIDDCFALPDEGTMSGPECGSSLHSAINCTSQNPTFVLKGRSGFWGAVARNVFAG
jgi:hypothetical protein